MESEAVIDIRDLTVRFPVRGGTVDALRGLTLRVPPRGIVGFLGPNGAGKTTTLHVLLGFVAPTSGRARLFGCDVSDSIARERIGYLPENPATYGFLTGRELLTLAGRLFRMRGGTLRAAVERSLADADLGDAADRRIATYSRGMMQRIGLAQALINDPDLLILDEPTGGLDPLGRAQVRRLLASLRERGKTVFFSSHELSEVELVCDRIAVLSQGALVAEGPVASLVAPGETLERYFLRIIDPGRAAP